MEKSNYCHHSNSFSETDESASLNGRRSEMEISSECIEPSQDVQITCLPSYVDLEEPLMEQQFKRLKICDDEDEQLETEEFSDAGISEILRPRTDGQLKPGYSSSFSLSAPFTTPSLGALPFPELPQGGIKHFNMRLKQRKIDKKRATKKEASITINKEKPRKSLFSKQ